MKKTLYFITVLCALFVTGLKARSQTSLSAGDVAIVGYNADGPIDNFSFILLTNVSAGTTINFTDFGWCSDGTGFQKANPVGCTGGSGTYGAKTDGAIVWTSATALPCGTEIWIQCQNSLSASSGSVSGVQATVNVPTDYMSLAVGGDQIFAYQGSLASPTFITGMSLNGNWDAAVATCDFSSVVSTLPAALNASNSFAILPEVDNAKYNCTVTSNSPANLRTAIFNSTNWTVDDASPVALPLNCSFSCNSCIAPSVTGHQPNRTLCVGGSTTLPITATGTGLTYQWQVNTGSGFNNVPNAAPYSNITTSTLTISSVTGAMSGYQYRCVVTGTCGTANSNSSTLTVDVVAGTSAVSPVSCNGGSNGAAAVTVTSGIGPFGYSWSPSGGTSSTASGLSANTYTCTITDNLTCTGTVQAIITEPAQPVSAAVTTVNNVTCPGGSNGNMTVTPSGGTPGYTYLWNTGATTATIFGLTAGTYTCTVRDSKNCPTTTSAAISAPSAFVTSSSTTPVFCNGGGNGTATVTVSSGGLPPYTYQWSAAAGSQTTQTATGLSAGSYSVTVSDANLCPTTATGIVVGQPSVLNAGTTKNDITCFGYNNGMAAVAPTGGNGGYSYLWTNGATSQIVTGLAPGSISVTITDSKGCTVTKNFTINQPSDFTIGTSQTAILCSGGTGSATVNVSGATSPYSYSWTPAGGTNSTATGLTAGTYTVIIEDFNGCQATRSFTLTNPPALTGTISKTDVNCFGGNNGTATVNITGGTGTLTYSWSPSGGTGATASGLSAGTYTCTIKDANNCQITRTTTVGQPAAALSGTTTVSNVNCFGGNNGYIDLTPTGGTAGYTYNWNDGATTQDRVLLAAGSYSVTITDANGCTAPVTATVTQPAAALSGTTVVTNVACFGNNTGAINLTPAGGTFPYTYDWGGGVTTEDRTLLAAGTYSVTITDNNGCTAPVSASVTQASDFAGLTLISSTNVSCFGGSNGAASVTPATGGTGTITYDWTQGTPTGDGTTSITGLLADIYTITATDANGCTKTLPVTITQPTALAGLTLISSTNISCFGGSNGSASVTPATGGTGTITYDWTPGNPTGDGTTSVTGLLAGTYAVTATDANGCTKTLPVTITQPTALAGLTLVSSTNVSCNGGSNGSATVTPATGGTGTITYDWTPGNPTGDGTTSITGLSQGTYTVTATDANGCTKTLPVTITQPTALAGLTLVSSTNVSCNGGSNGSATVTPATGGTGTITYNWTPGNPTGDGTTSITGLLAGTYTVTATDVNGCTKTLPVTITQPSALAGLTLSSSTNVACNGGSNGSATVTPATGGTGTITYDWTPGNPTGDGTTSITGLLVGTYTITATDNNGCTKTLPVTITEPTALAGLTLSSSTNVSCNGGSNGAATVTPATGGTGTITYNWTPGNPTGDGTTSITGLLAGTYTVTATDVNGCTKTLPVTITQPSALAGLTLVSSTNVSCNGGSNGAASVTVATGGTGTITYDWTPGTPTGDGTTSITGLSAGTYTVTATDANSCTKTLPVTITQPTALAGLTLVSSTNVSCFGGSNGSASVTPATGGTGTITYDWTPGNPTGDGTTSITGLLAGTYTVTATDANGCTKTLPVTITQPTALAGLTLVSSTNVSCFGGSNGSASVTPATGGTGTITYDWTPGNPTGDGTTSITGLSQGTYTVTATDANGCTKTLPVTITQPSALAGLTLTSSTNVSCNGGSNGSATVTPATGGTGTITYDWTPGTPTGDGTTSITGLLAGTYTVTATDANSCTKTLPVTITEPTALVGLALSSSTNVACNGGSNGSATVTPATGGTGTITYDWTPGNPTGDGTTSITGLSQGTYTITATDNNGCTKTLPVTITEPSALTGLVLVSSSNVSCFSGSNGSALVTPATGGTGTITYDWTPGTPTGDGTTAISGLTSGTYTVTATDANGCTKALPVTITQPDALVATPSQTNVSCNGLSTGSATVTVTGGTGTYTYSWSPTGGTAATASGLSAGTYTVTIQDVNLCMTTQSFTITQPALAVSSITATACNSYTLNGTTYNTSGTYTQTLTNAGGCDSTITLNLTVNYASAFTFAATACDSYTLNGTTYTTSGTYVQTLPNANGCDSTLTVNLTVKYATASSMSATACDSYTLNGTTYTTSGIYTQVLPNAAGCDSTITLDLTINYATNYTLTTTACDSYTLNGQTYTASGTYTQVLTNQVGCDWNFTLVLTINHSTATSLTQVACGNYTLNGQTYTASGVYTQIFENAAGCDSIVTLNLTIKQPTGSSLTEAACGSFTLNGTTYNTSGTYTQTFVNSVGCDSIVTLHLTIKTVNVNVETNGFVIASEANGATYQWLNCGNLTPISGATSQSYTVVANGDYAVVVTQDGCTDTSACVPVYGVSITENDVKNIDVTVYPNPTLDYVYIQTDGVIKSIDVMDISGKKYQLHFSVGKLDLTSMPSGIYLVRVTLNNGQQTLTRVIKM